MHDIHIFYHLASVHAVMACDQMLAVIGRVGQEGPVLSAVPSIAAAMEKMDLFGTDLKTLLI